MAGYGELPAGSSQQHSMTLAAPGRGELRLRQLKLTEGHRMMTAPVSCRRLGCAAHPDNYFLLAAHTLASPGWGQLQLACDQLSRAGNKHSSGQCVKVIFNFLL